MAFAEPRSGFEKCPLCACPLADEDIPVPKIDGLGQGTGWRKKILTPSLHPFDIEFLCSFCCPDPDREMILARACKIAHRTGAIEEKAKVTDFLYGYVSRPQRQREMRF